MRRSHLVPAALLAASLLPTALAAAPQSGPVQKRREVVVVGPHSSDHRVILAQTTSRAYLGVHLLGLTPELRLHFGAVADRGVLVSRVEPDSPAARAGIAVGDLITGVDGAPLATPAQLVGRILHREEGDEIELQIVRDGSDRALRATLAEAQRPQVELGQFVWRGEGDETLGVELDPTVFERVITVDPETINESVSKLLQGLEAEGGLPARLHLQVEQRQELEKRIAELERRLRELERQLHERAQH